KSLLFFALKLLGSPRYAVVKAKELVHVLGLNVIGRAPELRGCHCTQELVTLRKLDLGQWEHLHRGLSARGCLDRSKARERGRKRLFGGVLSQTRPDAVLGELTFADVVRDFDVQAVFGDEWILVAGGLLRIPAGEP